MSLFSRPAGFFTLAAGLSAFILLTSCRGGGGDGVGAVAASASVGPGGGQVVSADGRLVLDIPAGALAAATTITVTALGPGEGSPALQALIPDFAWNLEPDGLQFALPVAVTVNLPFPAASVPGSISAEIPEFSVVSGGLAAPLMASTSTLDVVAGSLVGTGELDHFSEIGVVSTGGLGTEVMLTYPVSLQSGTSGPINASLTPQVGVANVSWQGMSSGDLEIMLPSMTPFGPPGTVYDPMCPPFLVQDSVDVTCPAGSSTGGGFGITFSIDRIDAQTGASLGTSFLSLSGDVACTTSPGGIPRLIALAQNLTDVEAASIVQSDSACFDQNAPRAWVAGRDPTTGLGAAAVLVDLVTASVIQSPTFSFTGNVFDAVPVASPTGVSEALYTAGDDGFLGAFTIGCGFGAGFQIDPGFHEDTSQVDRTGGGTAAVSAGPDRIVIATVDDVSGASTSAVFLSGPVNSVVGNAALDKFLVVRSSQQELVFVELMGGDPTMPVETIAGSLRSQARRIRFDPVSGLGAVSDFIDNTLMLFTWDEQTLPSFFATVPVGDGPVGLDIQGENCVCAGFNDDTWTLVSVDVASQTVNAAVISPLPFTSPGGPLQPGHAAFVGDADNSVLISFFGADALGIIPNAFP